MASTSLSRTPASAGNRKTFTISTWVKRGNITSQQSLFSTGNGSSNPLNFFGFTSDGKFAYWEYSNSTTNISDVQTNRLFRDTSAWYHIVVAVDTTQATASDRIKIYVNGVQETSFSTSSYPSQNTDLGFNLNQVHDIGRYLYTGTAYFDGSMSHFHFIDGTAYQASNFGETDANGVWTPKTSPSVTYGTNGFFLKFENSGSMGTDSSPNGNNLTVSGNLTQTVDTPSNVYCTINPLFQPRVNTASTASKLYKGNTLLATSDADLIYTAGTLGVTKGKWYWEVQSYSGLGGAVGVCYNHMQANTSAQFWDNPALLGAAIKINGNNVNGKSGDGGGSLGVTYVEGDIYGFALDMDNYALYAHINGTYVNSGDPTSGASKTGSLLNLLTSGTAYLNSGEPVFPFIADLSTGGSVNIRTNFGNGYFDVTPVSSAGSNGNGSIFEYDVPTGYYALNTKNLATYG